MDPEALRRMVEENQQLKQHVLELERRLEEQKKERETRGPQDLGKVLKLLEKRDQTLEEIAEELQRKKDELEQVVVKLGERNEQLQLWVSTLALYQELLEMEPYAILGINREGALVLYNQTALRIFGDGIKRWRGHEVEDLDFSGADPGTPALVRQVLREGKSSARTITRGTRSITTTAYLIGTQAEPRGVLVKIAVADAAQKK